MPPTTPVKDSEVPEINFEGWAAKTATVSEPVLLPSLYSSTFALWTSVAVFTKLSAADGGTAKVTLNEPFTGNVTIPLATQLKAVPVIEQSIVPVDGVAPFVTVTAP